MQLHIENMTCDACARRITNAVRSVDPQAQVTADPPSRKLRLVTQADQQALLAALAEAGYPAERRD